MKKKNKFFTISSKVLGIIIILGLLTPLSINISNKSIKENSIETPNTSGIIKPLTIVSPEATTYTSAMSGYYPATYGFEDTRDGYAPHGWDDFSTGSSSAKVISGKGSHKRRVCLPCNA